MDQMLSYSNVNHASTNLPFAIIPPFPSSPGSIRTKGHTKRGIFHSPDMEIQDLSSLRLMRKLCSLQPHPISSRATRRPARA